jgi:pyruvate, water dikinase
MSDAGPTCGTPQRDARVKLRAVQEQFKSFLALLEQNNQVLKVIGDMEEKSQGEYLFDLNYIRTSLEDVRLAVREIIEQMMMLRGDRCEPLRKRYAEIDAEIARLLPDRRPIEPSPFVLRFEELGREHALSVGSKNAQLGEMKSRLGMPVPEGFAITAWAYKHFLDANSLSDRIRTLIDAVDFRCYEDLVLVSEQVQAMVAEADVPEDLAAAIYAAYDELEERIEGSGIAVRSSGLGEDSLFSFAGQYATFLNVGRSNLVPTYRAVIASKFTPQAIYYYLSHALSETDLAMSVGCVEMVDAETSGVIYTRDPVQSEQDTLLVHAVFGLGEFLVDGTLTPDVFRLSRQDLTVVESVIATKAQRLGMLPDGGTVSEAVPTEERKQASLGDAALKTLGQLGMRLEEHYGVPQDVEWAIDPRGRPYLLQTRPLQIVQRTKEPEPVDMKGLDIVLSGATTACPGAGSGPITHVRSNVDLTHVQEGMVVVAPNPFPGLITVMGKARALVTEVGGVASHMATLAREYRVPTLVGARGATNLEAGRTVTVDASAGVIVSGDQPALIAFRRAEASNLFEDTPLFQGFRHILSLVAPLNLLHPSDPTFVPERCRTLHDITRYAHQKAMEEMFCRVSNLESTAEFGQHLDSEIPLPVRVLFVDRPDNQLGRQDVLTEKDLGSGPMEAIWAGMREQGWPSGPTPAKAPLNRGFKTRDSSRGPTSYTVKSYAVLGANYMMLCLHLGYHFTTIEALCTPDTNKNYIRMQYKDGGASLERRVRRIRLVASLLSHIGFENASQADFLDATFTYADCCTMREKLRLLGRITMLTKQLDMALSNDAITEWYTKDFLKKLGLADVPA